MKYYDPSWFASFSTRIASRIILAICSIAKDLRINDVKSIFLVKENELIGSMPFNQVNFQKDFVASDIYKELLSLKTQVWYTNLFGTDDLYVLRSINSLTTGEFIGVIVIQVDKKLLIDDLNNDFGGTAQLAILDGTGQIILSPEGQESIRLQPYAASLTEKINDQISKKEVPIGVFLSSNGMDSEHSVLYGYMINRWIYLLQIPISEILGDIHKIKEIAIVLTAMIIISAIILGIWMARSISGPIEYICKKIKLVEQGDLTVQSKYSGKHEIGQLSQSFNHMTVNMKNLLMEMMNVIESVSGNSHEVSEIALSSAHASKAVMTAVTSVTNGATEQAKDAEKTTFVIKQLANQFNATEEHFSSVYQATEQTLASTESAKLTMDTLNTTTRETIKLSINIQGDIKKLVNRFMEISSIIGIIDGISDQTNLLSLNAAIEAARAGESGKGFAVVADEVRKLAVQSGEAVKNISDIIYSINQDINKTEKMIQNGAIIYIKQEEAVQNTDAIFKVVIDNMVAITKEVNYVYGLLEGLDELQTSATDSITSIAAIAEESAAAIEEVLASSEEQIATAEHLVNLSVELDIVVAEMNQKAAQFTIKPRPIGTA